MMFQVREEVLLAHELWEEITLRQQAPSPHVETKSIFLRWCPMRDDPADDILNSMDVYELGFMDVFPSLKIVLEEFAHSFQGDLKRAILVSLKPGGKVRPHADEGEYYDKTYRFHLPIFTSEKALVFAGEGLSGESAHLKQGWIYGFNNKVTHWAENDDFVRPRIHCIFDLDLAPDHKRQ